MPSTRRRGVAGWLMLATVVSVSGCGQTVVAVRARAESVVIHVDDPGTRSWYLDSARVSVDALTAIDFTGQLELGPGTSVRFERIGDGALYVVLEAPAGGWAARLLDADEQPRLTAERSLEIHLDSAKAIDHAFPYSGRAVIGDLVGPQTRRGAPILLEGTVDIVGRTVFTREPFLAGRSELRAGDQIEIAADDGDSIPRSHGFVRVDTGSGLRIASDAVGLGVRTRRFGAEDAFVLRRSLWSQLQFDYVLIGLAFVVGAVVQALIAAYLTPCLTWARKFFRRADATAPQ